MRIRPLVAALVVGAAVAAAGATGVSPARGDAGDPGDGEAPSGATPAWAVGPAGGACRGEAPVETRIDVQLDAARRRIAGRVRLRAELAADGPLDRAYVWLYPNHFRRRSPALDDVNFWWVHPRRFEPGWMRVTAARAAGRRLDASALRVVPAAEPEAGRANGEPVLLEVRLPEPVAPGAALDLELEFVVAVPARYGGFGCVRSRCTLLGGFHPMLAAHRAGVWDLEGPPACSRFAGGLALARPAAAVVAGRVHRGAWIPLEGEGSHLPVVVAPTLHETIRERRGVTLVHLSTRARPPAGDAARQVLPYSEEDHAALMLDAAGRAVDLADEIGAPIPPGTRLVVVEAPLRLELSRAHPGMAVVSDRLLRLFPVRRFRKFHERELVRALYATVLARRVAERGPERAADADATAEVAASYLVDLYTVRQYHRQEFARDLLRPVSFVPAVDQLLYAPQIAFVDAYFGRVGEDPFRDDVRRFAHRRPPPRLLYEKLRDLLSPEAFGDVMRAAVLGERPLAEAAEAAYGGPLAWFFAQWARPVPRVDYALGRRERERVPEGWRHRVHVLKRVEPGAAAPVEPVRVRVIDGASRRHDLVWDGRGDEGVVELVTSSPSLRSVELDPHHRLAEAGLPGASQDPRLDDRAPPRLKFLYNSFGALLDVNALKAELLFDFEFGRVHDIRNRFRLQLLRTTELTALGTVAYTRGFGRKITPGRLERAWTLAVSGARLDADFARLPGEPALPGSQASLRLGVGGDDRPYVFEPLRARGWALGARWTGTAFDGEGDLLHTGRAYFDLTRIVTPVDGHTLVGNLEGAAVAGDIVSRAQLVPAGGPSLLRGYGAAELFGRARLTAHAEWRGSIRHDLDTNFGHLLFLRAVGAALFADAGLVSSCDGYADLFAGRSLFASAGFGLRLFYDDLGVAPGMMALDFAVPFVLRSRECLGEPQTPATGGGLPFTLNITFLPPF